MIHTYRDADILGRRFFGLASLGFYAFVAMLAFAITRASGVTLAAAAGMAALVVGHQYFAYRRHYRRTCVEIRLGDDGTCELETKRRVVRLHVNEIGSVKYSPETDEGDESYTIRFQGGSLRVSPRMTDFADFLTRLKTLNPDVDLTSFPADVWPGMGEQPANEETGPFNRFVRSALFPLILIGGLVWLAIQSVQA